MQITLVVPAGEVPALKQRGTIRLTAAERKARWHERSALLHVVDREEVSVVANASRTKVASSLSKATLEPKLEDRASRRRKTLQTRFNILPRFVKGTFDGRYQQLRARAVKMLDEATAPTDKLSKVLSGMQELRSLADRASRIHKRQDTVAGASAVAWGILTDLSPAEFHAQLTRSAVYSAVQVWKARSKVTVFGHIASQMKHYLDAALRKENEQRTKADLPLVKYRDDVLIASARGAHWRQVVKKAVSDAIDLCELNLRGSFKAKAYRQVFGLFCERDELAGIGPREFAAAEVLLSLEHESQKRMAA